MNKLNRNLLPALLLLMLVPAQAQEQQPLELESLKSPPAALSALQLPIESWQTPQGSQVLFVRNSQLPMFDLQVVFDASAARDDGASGLAQLTLGMLDEGTATRNALQIAEGFDDIGAKLRKTLKLDNAVISLRSLSSEQHRDNAVALLSEILGEPSFPADNLLKTKNQLSSLSTRRQDYAYYKAFDLLFEHTFANHPYAGNGMGTTQIGRASCRERVYVLV